MSTTELHTRDIRQLQPDETRVTVHQSSDAPLVAEVVEDSLPALSSSAEASLQQADTYYGAGDLQLTAAQQKALSEPADPMDLDILPTGEVYMTQVQYRRRLNDAIGIGQWALRPMEPFRRVGSTVSREYALMIYGKFAAAGIGEAEYREDNARSSWPTACEAAKSDALKRACKDLGIALECWDKRYAEAWKAEYAVHLNGKWQRRDSRAEPRIERVEPQREKQPPPPPEKTPDGMTPMIPDKMGKSWEQGGYVIDANGKSWSFPKKLLDVAERAIEEGATLAITYDVKESKGKSYYNVITAVRV